MGCIKLDQATPELVDLARRIYESEDVRLKDVSARTGINYVTLYWLAKRQGWVKFRVMVHDIAHKVGNEIMAEAVKKRGPGRPAHVNGSSKPAKPAKPGKGAGKPPKAAKAAQPPPPPPAPPPKAASATGKPRKRSAKMVQALEQARALYESGAATKTEAAEQLKINRSIVYNTAAAEHWQDPRVAKAKRSLVILPQPADKAKAQLEVTLAAIRSMLSVRQINQLDEFEGLIGKYGHLLEVYLDPHNHTDVEGLNPEEAEIRVNEVQRMALRLLLPTDKDTLAGSIKAFTDALMRSIELKRTVAGLPKVPLLDEDAAPQPKEDTLLLDLKTLSVDELRVVQNGMELLERHQRERRDLPMPPAPPPIDDLLGPEPQVIEQEVPR